MPLGNRRGPRSSRRSRSACYLMWKAASPSGVRAGRRRPPPRPGGGRGAPSRAGGGHPRRGPRRPPRPGRRAGCAPSRPRRAARRAAGSYRGRRRPAPGRRPAPDSAPQADGTPARDATAEPGVSGRRSGNRGRSGLNAVGDQVGGSLGDGQHRRGRVGIGDGRHHRRIRHPQPGYPANAQLQVHDSACVRTHPAGADRMAIAVDRVPDVVAQPRRWCGRPRRATPRSFARARTRCWPRPGGSSAGPPPAGPGRARHAGRPGRSAGPPAGPRRPV
jgi:hypothetical protein